MNEDTLPKSAGGATVRGPGQTVEVDTAAFNLLPRERAIAQVDAATVGHDSVIKREEVILRFAALYAALDQLKGANSSLAERSALDCEEVRKRDQEIAFLKHHRDEEGRRSARLGHELRKANRTLRALTIAIRGGWSLRGPE